jgi:hypothetical protein
MTPKQRRELVELYAQEVVDSMDMDDLCTFAKDSIETYYNVSGDDVLMGDIQSECPHLLEEFGLE